MFEIKELRQEQWELTEKSRAILNTAEKEGRDLTSSEAAEFNRLLDASKKVGVKIAATERQMDIERETLHREFESSGLHLPTGAFKDHQDFFGSVLDFFQHKTVDQRLMPFRAAQGSDEQGVYSDPYGGFLVPTSVAPNVLSISAEDDFLAGLVTHIPMLTSQVDLNARVDKNHSTSVSGGLTVTRRPETVDGTSSRMQFEQLKLHAHELFDLTYATESVLQDSAPSFIAMLTAGFRDEFANNALNERINGTGVGEFLGVLKSGCLVTVNKETGQAASTIVTENIDKMAARCWRYPRSVWIANPTTRPQLRALVRDVGTGGAPVPYFNQTDGQETLDGRPIFFTEHAKALGTKGDLILGTWSEYIEGLYQPLMQAESIHVRFSANERAFKFWLRNDAMPSWNSALTPKNGDTLSPFVTLAPRT